MPLPQVDVPLFDVEIPTTKEKISCRPFLVKEEKLLVMASESGSMDDMIKATQQIVTNCSFGKIDGQKIALFELQKIFLDLRSVSISNIVDMAFKCGKCETQYEHNLDLQDLKIVFDEEHVNPVQLSSNLSLKMKYPDAFEMAKLLSEDNIDDIYTLTAKSIDKIYTQDEILDVDDMSEEDLLEWVENIPSSQFEQIRIFFSTMPALEHTIEFTCSKCEQENYLTMNGYVNFFV